MTKEDIITKEDIKALIKAIESSQRINLIQDGKSYEICQITEDCAKYVVDALFEYYEVLCSRLM